MTRERDDYNEFNHKAIWFYLYLFFLFQTMKKIWVIVTSIAGIAWLMWLWWTVWNDWFYSWYPMWFTTQGIQINDQYCGSNLTEDQWFQNHIETVSPKTRGDAQKAVNEYSKKSSIPLCVNWLTVSDFWFHYYTKSIVWVCKPDKSLNPRPKLKACRITRGR